MQDIREDQELRLRFQKLHEEVDSLAPPFSMPHPAPRRTRFYLARPAPALAFAATVAAVAIAIGLRSTRSPLLPGYDGVLWKSPTDFLLNTPGRDLLFTVPTTSGAPDLDALEHLDDAAPRPLE